MTGSYWAMKKLCELMTGLGSREGGQMTQGLKHAFRRKHCDLEGGWPAVNSQ